MVEATTRPLPELIRASAEPLPDIDDDRFAAFFDRFGDARVVLLGEASHGSVRVVAADRYPTETDSV